MGDAPEQPRDPYSLEPPTIPLSEDEDARLPETVNAEHPLEIWLASDYLIRTVEDSIKSISGTRTSLDRNLEEFEDTEKLLAQRREFLQWLQSHPLSHVFVSIVPLRVIVPSQK